MVSVTDKIFWMRAGLGGATGVATELIFGNDYSNGILVGLIVFLGSYYLSKSVWGKTFQKEHLGKLYTTGLGSYVMLFLFSWLFLYTIGLHYIILAVGA